MELAQQTIEWRDTIAFRGPKCSTRQNLIDDAYSTRTFAGVGSKPPQGLGIPSSVYLT
jgi:hypothetical protein